MGVNAVSGTSQVSASKEYTSVAKKAESEKKEEGKGAVYEASTGKEEKATYTINKMSAQERADLVSQLKADAEARESQFVSMIRKMMSEQVNAYGEANDIWSFLANGKFSVDPQTKLQAQQDIAEDGYYGVSQTAERIFDFASALAGDDEEKMKKMQEAFEKGFAMAEKTWGGKLPDISYQTKEAVSKKFEDYYKSKSAATAE